MTPSLVDGCAFLARRLHRDQTYGEGEPYTVHLEAVVAVMRRFGIKDEYKLGAGYLHDAIEDTEASRSSIQQHLTLGFGKAVACAVVDLVDACSGGEGANRPARNERWYTLIPKTKGLVIFSRLKGDVLPASNCILSVPANGPLPSMGSPKPFTTLPRILSFRLI